MSSLPRFGLLSLLAATLVPTPASAFCGFYVSGADADLYNQATVVVLMREGTRTVLSMQNAYEGPPQDFAMVVPVPTVVQEEQVHTLPDGVFARVDQLSAPRLVEYWEQDPCYRPPQVRSGGGRGRRLRRRAPSIQAGSPFDDGVTLEAEFEVGEYEIVILGARDSSGLDRWLRREGYNIPAQAEPVLRPYVAAGTKFFVARVNVERVRFSDGRAKLSPLRVEYDDERFSLPIRLGLINSQGVQDLLVHVLARGQRYEVANYDNVTVPTNLLVQDGIGPHFGAFYNSLFDRLLEEHPNSVVTEYSWNADGCDPCPTPALRREELAVLGNDSLNVDPYGWVLTRLHYRYRAEQAAQDLVFRPAPPLVGGRGVPDAEGTLSRAPTGGAQNAFQGRYVTLHPWEGPIACANPRRGRWAGPPRGGATERPTAVRDVAYARRDAELGTFLAGDVPELEVRASSGEPTQLAMADEAPEMAEEESLDELDAERLQGTRAVETVAVSGERDGCATCAVGSPNGRGAETLAFALAALALLAWRRRSRKR